MILFKLRVELIIYKLMFMFIALIYILLFIPISIIMMIINIFKLDEEEKLLYIISLPSFYLLVQIEIVSIRIKNILKNGRVNNMGKNMSNKR